VTQLKSAIGRIEPQKRTIKALGLGKISSSSVLPDNPAVRGMVASVAHLVRVETAEKPLTRSISSTRRHMSRKAEETVVKETKTEEKPADKKVEAKLTAAKKPSSAKATEGKPAAKKAAAVKAKVAKKPAAKKAAPKKKAPKKETK
jgi:ribosomal protein L30